MIVVRYGTLDHSVIRHGFRVVEKAKDKAAAEVAQNTDLLIKACIGIYALDGDKQVSLSNEGPDAEWTRFDDDLAEAMGLDMSSNPTARQALRTIYFTDGDVFSHAQAVIKFSGYNTEETDQSLLGE